MVIWVLGARATINECPSSDCFAWYDYHPDHAFQCLAFVPSSSDFDDSGQDYLALSGGTFIDDQDSSNKNRICEYVDGKLNNSRLNGAN